MPPRPRLQVVHNPAAFTETRKPGTQSRGIGSAKQGQHQAFASHRPPVPGYVGAKQSDQPAGQVVVGNAPS